MCHGNRYEQLRFRELWVQRMADQDQSLGRSDDFCSRKLEEEWPSDEERTVGQGKETVQWPAGNHSMVGMRTKERPKFLEVK